jgi:hypothetical protein
MDVRNAPAFYMLSASFSIDSILVLVRSKSEVYVVSSIIYLSANAYVSDLPDVVPLLPCAAKIRYLYLGRDVG